MECVGNTLGTELTVSGHATALDWQAGTGKGGDDAEQDGARQDIADDKGDQPGRLAGPLAHEDDEHVVAEEDAGLTRRQWTV